LTSRALANISGGYVSRPGAGEHRFGQPQEPKLPLRVEGREVERCPRTRLGLIRDEGHLVRLRAWSMSRRWVAEADAREPRTSRLEDALRLVHLYGEKESPK
jgi:hypothetical protein